MEDTQTNQRRVFLEQVMQHLRQQFIAKTPLPGHSDAVLTLHMLQRLYRYVILEGYGE